MAPHAVLIRFASVALSVSVLQVWVDVAPAVADCGSSDPVQAVQAQASVGSIVAGIEQEVASSACAGGSNDLSGSTFQASQVRDSQLDALCVREALSQAANPFAYCDLKREPGHAPVLTRGAVAAAFRRLPLPAAELVVQPPNGRTLVNFETNFFTEQGEFTRSVRLLGREVELRIWPESFTWRFGDGVERSTSEPGAAYPDLQVTHRYGRTGRVAPSVDVTYAAQFRVGGGEWRDVDGTVTVPGASESLRVVTARPVLVGG